MLNTLASIYQGGAGGAGASFESIATFTPSTGSTVTFSSIPSTYKSLQIRAIYVDSYTGSGALYYGYSMNFNGDTNAANYATHYLQGAGSAVSAGGVAGGSYGSWYNIQSSGAYNGGTIGGVSVVDIVDYASAKYKTGRIIAGANYNGSPIVGSVTLTSGLWLSTAAITSITISQTGSSFAAGCSFALYGIKG